MRGWCGDVSLSDFGLACPAGEVRGFLSGCNKGYIPPEMITQDAKTGLYVMQSNPFKLRHVARTSSDVYQAGLTLFELYTG